MVNHFLVYYIIKIKAWQEYTQLMEMNNTCTKSVILLQIMTLGNYYDILIILCCSMSLQNIGKWVGEESCTAKTAISHNLHDNGFLPLLVFQIFSTFQRWWCYTDLLQICFSVLFTMIINHLDKTAYACDTGTTTKEDGTPNNICRPHCYFMIQSFKHDTCLYF